MPLQVIETNDPLTGLASFRTSAVYEMLISLTALLARHRFSEWTQSARKALGDSFYKKLETTLTPYQDGAVFIEFGIGYDNHEDVPGFIDYVRNMPPDEFTFYMLGRTITREQVKEAKGSLDEIHSYIEASEACIDVMWQFPFDWLDDIPKFQNHICDLWQHYYDIFFIDQLEGLRSHWMSGLREKEAICNRDGELALYEHIIGRAELPPVYPSGYDLKEVEFIPIYFTVKRVYLFYGYGSMTILFDSQLSESRVAQINQARNTALSTLKAMSDENRLKILRLIVISNGTMSGKKLAEQLSLSPSAVSRHLSQLRDGNLITERSEDNRTITYTLNKDVLTSLPDAIMDYLYS